ncbi:hypothetical protein H4J50_18775 [Colwellia sp. 6M3]|jgi:hypothetical protein|uniref:hypothetical protein n=1 Tax=Colwellia sp. 6M3 TaxID=2759849 RepID=UPI0015F5DA86|nr:hypothetical protein [Colwellia sp. 6M3]MBA6418035.1 hypothetical protein [Colwellia sp. 6M3]
MRELKAVQRQEIIKLICDGCGIQASVDGDYEFHEFISIRRHCGYGSIHGDGRQIDIDLCQQCFVDMCGDTLRVTDESNVPNEYSESSNKEQLEYSNIFDVICQSKTKAHQLKQDCDLKLAVRDILSKNKVADNNELTIALRRVEQLWDAQYLSAEGNELHQLADLICAYEKKDWNSFFEEAPLADDDFMPDRSNFKSKFTFDEEKTASGMLSSIYINTNIDDESSRDSALADSNFDDAKQILLESISNVQAKYPELRLGQLLINAMNIQQPCPELFHIEDNVLAEKLSQLSL